MADVYPSAEVVGQSPIQMDDVGHASKRSCLSEPNFDTVAIKSLASETLPCGLPAEIWARIFSYLTRAHLLRQVIPVCRFFRSLAYEVGFGSKFNVGHAWGSHRFSREFLEAIPKQNDLCVTDVSFGEIAEYNDRQPYIFGLSKVMVIKPLSLRPRFNYMTWEPTECDDCLKDLLSIHSGAASLELRSFPCQCLMSDWLPTKLSTFANLTRLRIKFTMDVPRDGLSTLENSILHIAQNLKELHIDFLPSNLEHMLEVLDQKSHLTSLTICDPTSDTNNRSLEFEAFNPTAGLRSLVQLSLLWGDNRHNNFSHVINFPRLFRRYPNLEELHLKGFKISVHDDENHNAKTKDDETNSCFQNTKLKKFSYFGFSETGSDSRPILKCLPALTHLRINYSNWPSMTWSDDDPLRALFPRLEAIEVYHNKGDSMEKLKKPLAVCDRLQKLLITPKSLKMTMKLNFKGLANAYSCLPESTILTSYSSSQYFGRVPYNSVNLHTLCLGLVDICHLKSSLTGCPKIEDLTATIKYSDLSEGRLSQFLQYLQSTPTLRLSFLNLSIGTLRKPNQSYFDTFQLGDQAIELAKNITSLCNGKFSVEKRGDYLSSCPQMEEFVFTLYQPSRSKDRNSVTYRLIRTYLRDVKRFISSAFPIGCFKMSPEDIRLNRLPQAFLDRIAALEEEADAEDSDLESDRQSEDDYDPDWIP